MFTIIYGLIIALYCYDPKIAIIPLLAVIIMTIITKEELPNKIISVLILLLPFSSCNILLNGVSSLFSLFDLVLYFYFIFCIITGKIKKDKINFLAVFLIIYTTIKFLTAKYQSLSFFTSISIIVMLFTILTSNSTFKFKVDTDMLIKKYIEVGISSSFALIISYFLYKRGITIGNVTVFGNSASNIRINFNLLYTSYSYLSAYLASCAVALLSYCGVLRLKLSDIIKLLILIIGILISSSRTGLVVILLLTMFMYIKTINFKKLTIHQIIIPVVAIFIVAICWHIITTLRPETVKFFSDFGRFERWNYALAIFKEYPIVGYGFYNDKNVLPLAHNFILEYLSEGGIIFLFSFVCLLFEFIKRIKENKYKYILYAILLSNLFFTCLHENKFMYVIIIILLLENKGKEDSIE